MTVEHVVEKLTNITDNKITLFSAALAKNVNEKIIVTDRAYIDAIVRINNSTKYKTFVFGNRGETAVVEMTIGNNNNINIIITMNLHGSEVVIHN